MLIVSTWAFHSRPNVKPAWVPASYSKHGQVLEPRERGEVWMPAHPCLGIEWQGGLSTENPKCLRVWHESASPHITGEKSRASRLLALFLAPVCLVCFSTQLNVVHVVSKLSNHSCQVSNVPVQWVVFRERVQMPVLSSCLQRPAQAVPGNDYDRSKLVL